MSFEFLPGAECKTPSAINAGVALKGKALQVVVVGMESLNASFPIEETYDIEIETVDDDASMIDLMCVAMQSVSENTDIPADLVESIEINIVDDKEFS